MSDGSTSGGTATAVADRDQPELVAAAKALIPLADASAEEAETQGALTDAVVEAFHETGLWGIWVPRSLGGAELDPVPSLEIIEALSYGDASTGWVLMAATLATGCDAAYLGDEAVEQLYGPGRLLVHEGAGTQPGDAVPTEGGYLLTGEWHFASGVKHAEIIHTGSRVTTTGEIKICVFPTEQATLIENWDVLGLRATGSIDYTTDNLFVSEPFTYHATTNVPLRGGNVYTLGIVNFGMICHAAWALGIGRRMLDELLKLVEAKAGRAGSLGESPAFLGEYAMMEAKFRATRAFVYETWHDVQETIRSGDEMTPEQHNLTRLALQHTTWSVEELATWVYHAAGTTALRAGMIQRFYRDMHAGTQHFTSSPPIRQTIGRMMAGMAPGKTWQFLHLIDA